MGGANHCLSICHNVFARKKKKKKNIQLVLIQSLGPDWEFAPPPRSHRCCQAAEDGIHSPYCKKKKSQLARFLISWSNDIGAAN